ncbi:hypothetical protein PGTUg99_030149 [Puccinia graminis f. sp. tritici]|uniref:Uncharacterized protein n=1 Tax=Puccinia graminis f. sp. tritici TaxID=56615 RepID=A0A5B0S8P7_PUCGR|nr:hypothetical protein PGTUg99_030149 [Puccinia graminis f. sp. tritici]
MLLRALKPCLLTQRTFCTDTFPLTSKSLSITGPTPHTLTNICNTITTTSKSIRKDCSITRTEVHPDCPTTSKSLGPVTNSWPFTSSCDSSITGKNSIKIQTQCSSGFRLALPEETFSWPFTSSSRVTAQSPAKTPSRSKRNAPRASVSPSPKQHSRGLSPARPLWKARRALGYFLYFSAPQRVLLRFVVRGNLLDGLVVPSYFPRCHPLSPPRTPRVTPPTPVGPGTPPAAPKSGLPPPLPPLVRSKPRFRPSVLPAPCSPSAVYPEPPFRSRP